MSEPLEFTGERFTPECVREIHYEHIHRYVFARGLVRGKRVLDAACGEGYGSALLADFAASVVGVDVSSDAIEHAQDRYQAEGLEFRQADCLALPFGDDEFECIASFETLEHLEEQEQLLSEFRRVLKPGGFLLISTPDKAIYTDKLGNNNEFHPKELYRDEFESLVARHFPVHRLWGQKLGFQSLIWSLEESPGQWFNRENEQGINTSASPPYEAVYLMALCASTKDCLPSASEGLSLFDDTAESVYDHYYHEIRKNMAAGGLILDRDREIAELKAKLSEVARKETPWWRSLLGKG